MFYEHNHLKNDANCMQVSLLLFVSQCDGSQMNSFTTLRLATQHSCLAHPAKFSQVGMVGLVVHGRSKKLRYERI